MTVPGQTDPDQRRATQLTLIVAAAFFMENLDATVITTALPTMARSFGATAVDLGIGVTAYFLALSVFIPVSGWAADRFGARRVFAAALVVFVAASVLCGLCNTLWPFVAARLLQGAGGALMVPVGRMVVVRATAKPRLLRAMSTIIWPGLVAPIIGPPLGGFLTSYASWRWIFFLNVPLGLLALVLVLRLFPNQRGTQRRFDALGFVLTGAALVCLIYGLDPAGLPALNPLTVLAILLAGIGATALAVRHMRRSESPLIDLRPMQAPSFALNVWGGSAFRLSIGALPLLVPLLLQVGFGMNPFAAGLLVLTGAAGNLGMKTLCGPVLRRYGFRTVLLGNGLLSAAMVAACALLGPATPAIGIIAVLFGGGLARSLQFTALGTFQFADVPQAQVSGAATLSSMVQQTTFGMGIAFGALVLHLAASSHGGPPTVPDFRIAFLVVGAVGLLGVLHALRLHPTAGAEVSGHHPARA